MDINHVNQIKQTFQEKTANLPALTPDQEKQILHEIIQERIATQPKQSSQSDDSDRSDEQKEECSEPPAPQPELQAVAPQPVPQHVQDTVKTLVDMAVQEDLYKATKMAYDTKNPFLIDQYHDTLVNEFYQLIKLQERES